MQTEILGTDPQSIAKGSHILGQGGLVAFPTETVYGLGADARNSIAFKKIFRAKKRPHNNPLIVHVKNLNEAQKIGHFNSTALQIAMEFWPGPLTLLLVKKQDSKIHKIVASGQDRIGIRVPSNTVAQRLLQDFGHPVAAPSANLSNHVSPTQASHVLDDLNGKIDAVIDGGNCLCGLESTILLPTDSEIRLMRLGAITPHQIHHSTGINPQLITEEDGVQTPGRHPLHYSPNLPLRIKANEPHSDEVWIGFGSGCELADFNLSSRSNLEEAATKLYSILRQADNLAKNAGKSRIAVAPIPDKGIGASINDRLTRASGGQIRQ